MTTGSTPAWSGLTSTTTDVDVLSHRDLVARRSAALEVDFASGKYERFVWPYCLLGFYAVFVYLLLPPTRSRLYFYARYPLLALHVGWSVRSILVCRSLNPPMQYGIGLINSYSCLWLAFHLLWRDTRSQSWRLVAIPKRKPGQPPATSSSSAAAAAATTTTTTTTTTTDSQQQQSLVEHDGLETIHEESAVKTFGTSSSVARDGSVLLRKSGSEAAVVVSVTESGKEMTTQLEPEPGEDFHWQSLPDTLVERFSWICTMLLCLRGEGTSHGVRQLPSPPPNVRISLRRSSPQAPEPAWVRDTRSTVFGLPTRAACMRYYALTWAVTYLLLDVAKNLIERDPYFTGFVPIDSPLPLPLLSSGGVAAKAARLTLCGSAILVLLTNLTSLPPLIFCTLLFGDDTYRPWLFPTTFGSGYVEILADSGIAGSWGRWWHQMFRLTFEAPLAPLCQLLRLPLPSSSPSPSNGNSDQSQQNRYAEQVRLVAGMVLAFGLSGSLHAAGSRTLNGTEGGGTRPWAGSGAFFLVQPLGIVLEMAVRRRLANTGLLPPWLKTAAALVWVHFWLYHTAPLLADDVARGGVWTTEVVPVSLIGGLLGTGWLRWERWMFPVWHWDAKWWKSGIAF